MDDEVSSANKVRTFIDRGTHTRQHMINIVPKVVPVRGASWIAATLWGNETSQGNRFPKVGVP